MNNPTPATDSSPCVRNCCLDSEDICLGCGRSLAEIVGWHSADSAQKEVIRANAERRRQAREALRSAQQNR